MRNLFIAILILSLSIPLFAQKYPECSINTQDDNPGFIVSVSKNLIGTGRFDLAIGAPVGNKIYYSFYFSTIPGPKLEYVFANCWVTGFSLRNYQNVYSLRYHFGMKLSRRIMISESFKSGEGAFEITYCF